MWTLFRHNKQRVAWCFLYIMLAMVVSKGTHFHKEGTCCGLACSITLNDYADDGHTCCPSHAINISSSCHDTTQKAAVTHSCAICSFLVVLLDSPIDTFCCVSQAPFLERSMYNPLFVYRASVDAYTVRGPPSHTDYIA